jgi:hypothetical protein
MNYRSQPTDRGGLHIDFDGPPAPRSVDVDGRLTDDGPEWVVHDPVTGEELGTFPYQYGDDTDPSWDRVTRQALEILTGR